ncbi:hypothetical protein J1605_007453 [Eschrichtius robustus]|uniref:Enamelin n=1 Tax=Eschrichtius robustus TaxID=9764 RepID=A0AB34H0M7_ESCRO|nr:hypothetical protein J1605_007453 [Eschrichtius robustus]
MLLLQCRHEASSPKLDNLMAHLGPLYGNGMQLPQLFLPYQMPMWPQPPPNKKRPQKPSSPSAPKHQSKTDQAPETQKPNQPQLKQPLPEHPLKQPSPTPTQPQEETQTPQRVPSGYGRPPVSNEEGGNPYFGYFGYHGFGGHPPYYSEEMFEQDFEKPKEKDPPKTESPATDPSANSTVPETNSTQSNAPNPRWSQGGNDTSPTGNSVQGSNTVSNPTAQNSPAVNVSGQGVPRSQTPRGPSQTNTHENYPNPNIRSFPAGRQWRPTGTVMGHRRPKDNPLALQDYTPSFGLAPGENQDTSPVYTEDSHTKHARHTISPTSILPGQRNSSEKRLPGESQNPSPFRDDVSTLKRNTPCSINQLGQRGIMPFPETSSLQSKNTPCLKSDLGGEGNILEQIFEGNPLNERTVDLTPEQLVIGTPDEGPKPEGIPSEVQGNEGERQQRASSILQLPCFGSKLTKHHTSSTGTPSSFGRQGSFDGDPIMPTEIPNSLAELATRAQFQNINVDPLNADEHTLFDSLQVGTNPQDEVQDCLLLQA